MFIAACPGTALRLGSPMDAHGFYDEPGLYDVLHSRGTASEVRGYQRLSARLGLDTRGPWLEPACGSGRYLRAAIARGVRVAGFDMQPHMLAYARRRLARYDASLWVLAEADMRTFDIQAFAPGWVFQLAFNPINTIRHLHSDEAILAHFECIHRALRPGGVYVVGLSLSMYGFEQPSEDIWHGARGTLRVQQVVQYTPAAGGPDRAERVHNVLAVDTPGGTRIVPSSYTLRSYDREQWEAIIDQSPFEMIGCVDEAGRSMTPSAPGYALWVLRRGR